MQRLGYNWGMSRKLIRSILVVAILLATIIAFTIYFTSHPGVFRALGSTSPWVLLLLFVLYGAFYAALVWIQRANLALCDVRLGTRENILVVMYSAIINFFGPLQSGPAFRGAYLKTRHNVNLKKYAVATLAYYGFFALFSGLLLLSFLVGWWILVGAVFAVIAAPLLGKIPRFSGLDLKNIRQLALATLTQVAIISVIYYIEIHSLLPHATYLQALAYTGAANFALFVSLTPGAIGFREAFLLFSQRLHHIDSATIAAASVIDRSVYITFLLITAAFIFGLHANDYLKSRQGAPKSPIKDTAQ
jgi:uncharacterized membrane protein YbhN (UPF0104 family)